MVMIEKMKQTREMFDIGNDGSPADAIIAIGDHHHARSFTKELAFVVPCEAKDCGCRNPASAAGNRA